MWRGIPSKTHCRLCSFLVKNAHQSKSTGVLTVEEPFPWERKFIVFESYLRELLINCTICGQAVGNLNFSVMGTLDVIGRVCERLHKLWWRSQQLVRGSGAGAGNFLLAAGMLYSCCVVATTIRCLGAQIITECAFYNYQRAYLLPAVKQVTGDVTFLATAPNISRTVCLPGRMAAFYTLSWYKSEVTKSPLQCLHGKGKTC
ncbi:uncharacterized protein LOC119166761 isoform X5 [Rhipicephalus microplus]|uniref:uncharacterized protein LOC119166761 isoform X5 n=1 Tax=Rhipicephalus microplus TaxID=6941 RepID=UPI003F6B7907